MSADDFVAKPLSVKELIARVEGACIAMDMAMAYGYLDEPKRKILTRPIVGDMNPYLDRFPGGHRALSAACKAIGRNRWAPRDRNASVTSRCHPNMKDVSDSAAQGSPSSRRYRAIFISDGHVPRCPASRIVIDNNVDFI